MIPTVLTVASTTTQPSAYGQRGATLVIAMIMLILATLFVLAAINMSSTNLLVIGNQQARNEAIQAAQQVVEQVSSTDFTKDPAGAVAGAFTGAITSPVTVDVAGSGKTGYSIAVPPPSCLNSVPIKLTELSATNPDGTPNDNDIPCFGSAASAASGVAGGVGTGNSYCAATQWDVSATATDPKNSTGTQVTLHQGVSKRVRVGSATC